MTVSTFFENLHHRIHYLESRKQVIDQNIINVDTPGYQEQDLSFKGHLKAAQSPSLLTTNPHHLSQKSPTTLEGFEVVTEQNPIEISPNGNTVNLEKQHLQMAQTADEHELATRIYRDGLAMHRAVLGKN